MAKPKALIYYKGIEGDEVYFKFPSDKLTLTETIDCLMLLCQKIGFDKELIDNYILEIADEIDEARGFSAN